MPNPDIPLLVYGKYHWFTGYVGRVLSQTAWSDLSRAQIIILGGIYSGETRAIRLAEMTGVSRQAISKTVKELQNRGLLTQQADIEKGNSSVLMLTEDGQACVDTVNAQVDILMAKLKARFGGAAVKHAMAVLSADWSEFLE